MRQLKYFTSDVQAIEKAQDALEKQGFDKKRLKVFSRDNSQRHYDGLFVHSEKHFQNHFLSSSIFHFVIIFCAGTLALSFAWLSFTQLALLVFLGHGIVYLAKLLKFSNKVTRDVSDTVYFLVIDVDKESEEMVSRIAERQQNLIAQ